MTTVIPDVSGMPVRFSHLKAYGRSAKHGWHARTTDMKATAAMQFGKSVDAVLYGTRKVVAFTGKVRNGKAYDEFLAANPDSEILLKADYDRVMGAVDAIKSHKAAAEHIVGIHQQTLSFDFNGLTCRSTPDTRGNGFLTELKCTTDTSPWRFPWHIKKMHYHTQLWMQRLACEANPRPGFAVPERLLIVTVEDKAPHVVTVFEIMPSLQDQAARTLMLWSEKLKVAEQSKVWTGYSESIVPVEATEEEPELVFPEGDDE